MTKKFLLLSALLITLFIGQTANANHYHNNTNYNNSGNYNKSCNGGTYNGYSHGFLRDGQYTQSTKSITNGHSYVSIVCNNGNLSRKILSIRCDSGYSRQGNYCRENRNSNSHYNNNYNNSRNNSYNRNSCNAGTYNGYSHRYLKNGQSTRSSKNITNGRSYVTVKCRNGNLSRTINRINCNSGYSRQGNYCKQNRNSNSHYNNNYNYNNSWNNNYDKDSCNAGIYNGYSHSYLKNGQSTRASKNITNGRAYVLVQCRNGNLSRRVIKLRCNNGYARQGNYCRERNYTYNW